MRYAEEFKIYQDIGFDRYALFIVSQELFNELSITPVINLSVELAENGFQNIIFNGVPVVFNDILQGKDIIPIEKSLINATKSFMEIK